MGSISRVMLRKQPVEQSEATMMRVVIARAGNSRDRLVDKS